MYEMLGNRYFLARRFQKAIHPLEEVLKANPAADNVKKKLIICYIQTKQSSKAFSLFREVVEKDPRIIIDTDAYYDDCPCIELIPRWEMVAQSGKSILNTYLILGMLYLYCNTRRAIDYFNKASKLAEEPQPYRSILTKLNSYSH